MHLIHVRGWFHSEAAYRSQKSGKAAIVRNYRLGSQTKYTATPVLGEPGSLTGEEGEEDSHEDDARSLRNHIGEFQSQEEVIKVGKAEDYNQHDSDHFHFTCWKADALLREGQMFLLGSFPPRGHTSLSQNGNGAGGGGGCGGAIERFDYIIQTEVGVTKKQEAIS